MSGAILQPELSVLDQQLAAVDRDEQSEHNGGRRRPIRQASQRPHERRSRPGGERHAEEVRDGRGHELHGGVPDDIRAGAVHAGPVGVRLSAVPRRSDRRDAAVLCGEAGGEDPRRAVQFEVRGVFLLRRSAVADALVCDSDHTR